MSEHSIRPRSGGQVSELSCCRVTLQGPSCMDPSLPVLSNAAVAACSESPELPRVMLRA